MAFAGEEALPAFLPWTSADLSHSSSPRHCHRHRPPWPAARLSSPPLASTAAAGPGKRAGQARPCVTPAACQHSGATAGKAPGPASRGTESYFPTARLSALARVPGGGLIHRLPQLCGFGKWPLEARSNTPGVDGQAASGVIVLRTGEDQQQEACGSRPSILLWSPRRPESAAGPVTICSFSAHIWTVLECWGWSPALGHSGHVSKPHSSPVLTGCKGKNAFVH